MVRNSRRGWLSRLGLREENSPDDWVVLVRRSMDAESHSQRVKRTIRLLTDAGIEAQARPYVRPDGSGTSGYWGRIGPDAGERAGFAVVIHRRDQTKAEDILRRQPKAEPISDEELARLAEGAGPPPPE